MRTDRIFARLDREPEPPEIDLPRMTATRKVLFGSTLVFYGAIVVAVLTTSRLVRLDWQIMFFRPYEQWPQLHAFIDYYVVLGQRGPTAVMVTAWLGWRSWRQHTLRPLLALGVALLLLNITVGAVKLGLGRLGPHYATQIGSAELFMGGDIFPSGHTANAVVTWGILAYLASTPRTRRHLSVVSAVVALGVGAATVYLGTHWVSDVLLGWAAGLLIVLALPWFEPLIGFGEAWIFEQREKWRARRAGASAPAAAPGSPAPAPRPAAVASEASQPQTLPQTLPREKVVTVRPAVSGPRSPAPHLAPRTHTVRSERSPVTPPVSRRPQQHPDRVSARGTSAGSAAARPVAGG
ncbi:phosphatase PAP2 family protein [Streptomyces sp. GC420]|uniref:phosphatase PAP2 family protein n=1 Tax=Streptomyces sp. GC420 TaxID=2697568 RepID=UPI0028BDAC75|nr:phosphatase PAP2 family protein [Streptomyces sp. GC420]